MNRGEVWLVEFDPSRGQEFQKTRRAVIVSEDWVRAQELRIVVPITGWQDHFQQWPWMVRLLPSAQNGLTKTVAANPFQVKSFATERFRKRLGVLSDQDMVDVMAALAMIFGLPNPEV